MISKFKAYLESTMFREAEDGRTIIYPWGFIGPAYATTSETVKKRMRILYAISMATTVIAVVLTNFLSIRTMLPILGIYGIVYFGVQKLILATAPDLEPLSRTKGAAVFAKNTSEPFIQMGVFGCAMFVLLGVLVVGAGDAEAKLAGYFAIAVFSALGAGYVCLWIVKRRLEG